MWILLELLCVLLELLLPPSLYEKHLFNLGVNATLPKYKTYKSLKLIQHGPEVLA